MLPNNYTKGKTLHNRPLLLKSNLSGIIHSFWDKKKIAT